jgi:prepilin signal peptidase PulO-like enzyme (type II secretory pathway)
MIVAMAAAAFGLAFGSFANAAIDRLTSGRSLQGRSGCDACGRELRAIELVPILSYMALRGRCATCAAPIGMRTPAVEAACGIAFAAAFTATPQLAATLLSAALVAGLIAGGVAWRHLGGRA